jgi:tetratricopeptide (TPR) repeat protein
MKTEDPRATLQLIVLLASAGDRAAAMAEAGGIRDKPVAAEAWRLLSEINANMQRWDEALSDIEIALQQAPDSRSLRFTRARLLGQQGEDTAALVELEALAREARDSPELLVELAGQLAVAGRNDEADQVLSSGLRSWPADAGLHKQLARLRWQRGAGLEAMRPIEDAIERHPRELHLRLVAADLLRSAGANTRALELLEGGLALAPDSGAFLTSTGVLLEGMDRVAEALPLLREARRRAPQSVAAQRNLVPVLLRTGATAEALTLCNDLLARFPLDQLLIAQRSTALRILGDPEYRRLYDYGRLVKSYTLRPVPPFTSIEDFNATFARELTGLHHGVRHPLEQSLRGGSQTERNLPRDNAVIAAFFAMLDAPIRDYMESLGADASHPLDSRSSGGYRISGSWSVQLHAGGYHTDHVHPRGWLSSAYYVSLPDVSDADSRAGWIKFGEAGMKVAGCGPEHFVRPAAGMLVLFPSYLWHGTVPFAAGGPRLTAAFDVVPD